MIVFFNNSREEREFVLFGVAMWHCVGSVVVTFVSFHCFLWTQSLLSSVGSDPVTFFSFFFGGGGGGGVRNVSADVASNSPLTVLYKATCMKVRHSLLCCSWRTWRSRLWSRSFLFV